MSLSRPSDDADASGDVAHTTLHYRCVCGELVEVDDHSGGTCPACGRHYASEVLRASLSATLPMSGDVVGFTEQATADVNLADSKMEHFRLLHMLGKGGMGAVYQALDESLQRDVALKVIQTAARSPSDTDHVQRLFQEARAQARVNHPNVVHIYFVGREGDTPFLAMELVHGPSLAEKLEDGPLAFGEVVRLSLDLISALDHAAKFDIVHGDIKPSNVLLAGGNTVKLSDFGLARRLSEEREDLAKIAGTPNYLSPEAARGEPLDIRSDLYSLGVTLFEMTFGRLPYSFSGSSLKERLQAHQESPIEFPDPWPASVPQGWKDVLARLLAKSPQKRYQTYAEVTADIRRLQPLSFPKAGRVTRGLAWFVDLALLRTAQEVLYAPVAVSEIALQSFPLLHILTATTSGLIPALAAVLQAWWRTTPGKKLFQLRIVDEHGLAPPPSVLAARSVLQYAPVWLFALRYIYLAAQLPVPLGNLLSGLAALWIIADAGWACFHPQRKALHDWIFGTQVVLDAQVSEPQASGG